MLLISTMLIRSTILLMKLGKLNWEMEIVLEKRNTPWLSWKRVVVDETAASEGGSRRTTESEKRTEKSMKETTKKPITRIKVKGGVAHLSVRVSKSESLLLLLLLLSALGFLIARTLFSSIFIATNAQQLILVESRESGTSNGVLQYFKSSTTDCECLLQWCYGHGKLMWHFVIWVTMWWEEDLSTTFQTWHELVLWEMLMPMFTNVI